MKKPYRTNIANKKWQPKNMRRVGDTSDSIELILCLSVRARETQRRSIKRLELFDLITMRAFDIAIECVTYASNQTKLVYAHFFRSPLVMLRGTRMGMPFAISYGKWITFLSTPCILNLRKSVNKPCKYVTRFSFEPKNSTSTWKQLNVLFYLKMIIICEEFSRNS